MDIQLQKFLHFQLAVSIAFSKTFNLLIVHMIVYANF